MRLQFIQCIIIIAILCEAKKRRPGKSNKKIDPDFDEAPNKGDVYPNKFIPVPFGHIYKDGFQHPAHKQPIDFLEFDRKYKKGSDDFKIEPIKMRNEKPKGFASPKDSFYFGEKEVDTNKKENKKMWLDMAANHAANIGMAWRRINPGSLGTSQTGERTRPQSNPAPNNRTNEKPDSVAKEQYFSKSSFDLEVKRREFRHHNWTTCDEFGRVADFHPKDVINIEWVPFYTWSSNEIRRTASLVHRFFYPTKKLVKKYREEFGPYLNKTPDWDSPKLLMKSDIEMLLVAADRKGLFDGIPYNEVPNSVKSRNIILPMLSLRLKFVDPYLAMMFCEYQYATIMAVSGNEPTTVDDMVSEARKLKFQGSGHPVARDLEIEMTMTRMERENKLKIERERFINVEDQAEAELPF